MQKITWIDATPDSDLVDVMHELARDNGGFRQVFAAFLQNLEDVTNDMGEVVNQSDDYQLSTLLLEALTTATKCRPSGYTELSEDVYAIIAETSVPEVLGAYLAASDNDTERIQILDAVARIPERVDH